MEPEDTAPHEGGEPPKESEEIVEDTVHQSIAEAYMGTIMMDVRYFNRDWSKDDPGNREIRTKHLSDLITSFKAGIRRCAADTRLKASMNRDKFYKIIEPTMMRLGHDDHSKWTSILTVVYGSAEHEIVHIQWPHDAELPTLDAGQHRRAALQSVLKARQKRAEELAKEGKPNVPVKPEVFFYANLTQVKCSH